LFAAQLQRSRSRCANGQSRFFSGIILAGCVRVLGATLDTLLSGGYEIGLVCYAFLLDEAAVAEFLDGLLSQADGPVYVLGAAAFLAPRQAGYYSGERWANDRHS
jgi:hypothetical protein